MIRQLSGTIIDIAPHQLVVEVYGVGYAVHTDAFRHQHQLGSAVRLYTYLAVRETALDLYGFLEERELRLFEHLLTVPKVGPRLALTVISQASADTLVEAVLERNPQALATVPGIGKKTAEQIVTTLADTFDSEATLQPAATPASAVHQDAVEALVALGFTHEAARKAAAEADVGSDTASIITKALKQR